MATVTIPVQVEPLEDGWVLLTCDSIQGCMAEAETVEEAIPIIEDVARILIELGEQDGAPLRDEYKNLPPGTTFKAVLEGRP
jgi:predicted RNase H-like HicB family nuclease